MKIHIIISVPVNVLYDNDMCAILFILLCTFVSNIYNYIK